MREDDSAERRRQLKLTRDIVTAYLASNPLAPDALPSLITGVYDTIERLGRENESTVTSQLPAVPIEDSVTDDAIICLEDGLPFKSLKRHIRTKYELTPAAYREKWGLPADYPMVAPNYAKQRSELARKSGLGRRKP